MLARWKQKFISKKQQHQQQRQVKVKVFHYTNDMRPVDDLTQQKTMVPWSDKPAKESSLDLKTKYVPPLKYIPTPPSTMDLPLAPNEPAPNMKQHAILPAPETQTQPHQQQQISQEQIPQQAPVQQTSSTLTEEEKQRQEKATQWIESNMRRKSTLPIYPSLHRYEIVKKLGE
jgi:hypothetical protein